MMTVWPLINSPQSIDDEAFRFGVESCRGLVQDHDRAVANDGPRDADALPLPARKRITAFTDDRVVTVRHAADEFVGIGHFCRGNDLVVSRARESVS